MSPSNYEVPVEMRDFAEKSVEQARKAFEGFVGAAQKAAGTADETASSLSSNARAVSTKTMGYAEANIRAAFDHASKLVRAKDMSEVMALQSEYVKSQLTAMQEQAKDIGSAFQSAAKSSVQSAQDATQSMTKNF